MKKKVKHLKIRYLRLICKVKENIFVNGVV